MHISAAGSRDAEVPLSAAVVLCQHGSEPQQRRVTERAPKDHRTVVTNACGPGQRRATELDAPQELTEATDQLSATQLLSAADINLIGCQFLFSLCLFPGEWGWG